MSRRRVGLVVAAAALAAVAARVAAPATPRVHPVNPMMSLCGVERWSVKTMTDPAARRVNLSAKRSTIETLIHQRAPQHLGPLRRGGIERTTFQVKARLLSAKIEADGDVHLVMASPSTGRTMIAEFPSVGCTNRSVARARIRRARSTFDRLCGTASRSGFTDLAGTATVTGVGFFDFKHGQRGVAPNGVELHPVLTFSAVGCRPVAAPPPPPPPDPPPPPMPGNCAASYPSVCIPPPPPDLDCGDIPYRNFTVLWSVPDPDPHGFDGDRDGVGCEN